MGEGSKTGAAQGGEKPATEADKPKPLDSSAQSKPGETKVETTKPEEKGAASEKALPETQDPKAQKAATDATDGRLKKTGDEQVALGNLPDTKVEKKAEKTEVKLEDLPKLTEAEAKRAQYLQENLKMLMPRIWKLDGDLDPAKAREKAQKDIKELIDKVEAEKKAGKFGPASQEAYKRFVDWYEKEAVPGTVKALDGLGIPIPPGCPCDLPLNENGRPIQPDLFKSLVGIDKLEFKSKLDTSKVPSDENLDAIDKGLNWLDASNNAYEETTRAHQQKLLTDMIKEEGLPEGWLLKPGDDKKAWVQSASEMVDLASRTKNYVEAMHSLYKSAPNQDFPFKLPPGTTVEIDVKGVKTTIRAGEEENYKDIIADKNGTMTKVHFDLPQDLRQEHLSNNPKIERMREWLNSDHTKKVEQALVQYLKYQQRPEAVIMYGDQEIPDSPGHDYQGRYNAKGELLGIVDATEYKPKEGERLHNVNLLDYDFTSTKTDDGKILVEQTIQGWDMSKYAYQNIRAFGDKVGQPMPFTKPVPPDFEKNYESFDIKVNGETRKLWRNKTNESDVVELMGDGANRQLKEVKLYNPNDFVVVRNGPHMEIRKASQLDAFRTGQRNSYYFEKGLMVGLDVAMLATAATGIGGIALGSRAAAAGVQLTGRQIAWEATKATVRATVAGAGVFNNAGAREQQWGRDLNTARSVYFMADITQGLLRGGVNLMRAGQAAESMGGAQKLHTIIYGTKGVEGVNGAKAFEGLGWIKRVDQGANIVFRATEAGYVPIVGHQMYESIKAINEKGARNPLEDAVVQIGDGRGLQKPEAGSFDMKNAKALEGAQKVIDGYTDTLTDGRSDSTKTQVKQILDRTKELMDPAKAAERDAFKKSLMKNVTFSNEEIIELEKARKTVLGAGNHADEEYYSKIRLNQEDLSKLLDPARRSEVQPPEVARLAEEILNRKDKDVRAASLIALTYLSRDDSGKVADTLVSSKEHLNEYKTLGYTKQYSQGGSYESSHEITVKAREIETSLSSAEAIKLLRRDLETGNTGNRGIATGDMLVRLGAITHRQYGGILQDVLNDPKASPKDKMRAMVDPSGARIATIIDGARYEDTQGVNGASEGLNNREIGKRFGLTAEDMIKTLEKTASDPNGNPDVKAMATTLLYGLQERDVDRRAQILTVANGRWTAKNGVMDGSFAGEVTNLLKRDMTTVVGSNDPVADNIARERKLNAAISIARITPASDTAAQAKINEAIAQSFSTTNGEQAVKVIDALLPDRIKQLEKDNPEVAAELRRQAVEMIKMPNKEKLDAADAALLKKMPELLKRMPALFNLEKDRAISDPVKQSQAALLAAQTRNLIDPSKTSQFAKWYPEIRRASIENLAAFGDRSAADLIRGHIAQSGSQKIGDKTITFDEPDAAVRKAAIKALQVLKDDDLSAQLPKLIASERDADVARELRDVRFLAQQIEPNSPKWDEIKEKYTNKLAFAEKLEQQLGSKTFNYEDFLKEQKLELLDANKFSKEAYTRANDSWNFFSRLNPFGDSLAEMENKAITKLEGERNDQFKQLVDLAKRDDNTGLKAKIALFQIMEKQGGALGQPGDRYITGVQWQGNRTNPDWAKKAAEAFKEVSTQGYGNKEFTQWAVRNALENNIAGSNAPAMNELLDSWKNLHKSGVITTEEYAGTLAVSLRGQLDKAVNTDQELKGNEEIQKRLLRELAESKHREIFPVFDAVANGVGDFKGSRFPAVRAEAGRLLSDFQDSVTMMWDNTRADSTSTPEARAERIRKALQGEKKKDAEGNELQQASAEKTVQEIFNAYKGVKIADENDPGLPYLYKALGSENERVRLAAAKVIAQSDLPHDSFTKESAQKTLLELAEKGSKPRYKQDAEMELLGMKGKEFGIAAMVSRDVLLNGVGWLRTGAKPFADQSDTKRAERINTALTDNRSGFNHEDTVKAIFEATNGRQILSENDARREALSKAMKHENERVRLAAAWALSESSVVADRDAATTTLASIAVDSADPRRAKEAQELLKDMINIGSPEDQKRAFDAWKKAFDSRREDGAAAPPAIPAPGARMTAYYSRAPLSELQNVIDNASLDEKKQLAMAIGSYSNVDLAEWLKPAPTYDYRSMTHGMSTINCHGGGRQQFDPGFTRDRLEDTAKREEGKLDDYFRSLMLSGRTFNRSADLPGWSPAQKGEKPQLAGKSSTFRIGTFGTRQTPFDFNGSKSNQIDKKDLDAIMKYLQETDKKQN